VDRVSLAQSHRAAFSRWFGASKVVDARGEPLVVYHGTSKIFDAFQARSRSVNTTTFGPVETERTGIFLSSESRFSRQYGSRVLALYARIENPAEITRDTILDFAESLDPFGQDRSLWQIARHVRAPWQAFEGELGRRFVAFLQEAGHDGATFTEDLDTEEGNVEGRTFVAFSPMQIKSATSNDGSYDTDDPSILSDASFLRSSFSAEDFDFEPVEEPVETEASRHRAAFSALVRGAELRIGSKVFVIITDQGIVKYATLAGTAGRKFYKVQPISLDPFEVEVRQVLQMVPEVLGPEVARGRLR
jgi:hypothetical protein